MSNGPDHAARAQPASAHPPPVHLAEDVCALPLVRRLAAMLDRDPAGFQTGGALPRFWHVLLFNTPTRQSALRRDGVAELGITLPDIGLPRLMLGGRQIVFHADIAIGATVRRETRQGGVQMKQGRSGRFALVPVEHRIFTAGATVPAVVETNDYVLREAAPASAARPEPPAPPGAQARRAGARAVRSLLPDPPLLFRYSAITDNPHRIHYDLPYAHDTEGYPALVVNGSIPAMFLLEMFRDLAGREPARFTCRNRAPMFCGRPLTLMAEHAGDVWRLSAQNETGVITFDAEAA